MSMKAVICGNGEIGSALYSILHNYYEIGLVDLSSRSNIPNNVDILHICFPFSKTFIQEVKEYQKEFKPIFTIIHSTVPVGSCRLVDAIHSPVIGQHPFLEKGLMTFSKMLSGAQASKVADYFRRAGFKIVLFDKQETTEAAKLFLTEYYRECIEFAKKVKTYCDKNNLNFSEVYRIPNQIYNDGYKKLGHEEFVRPILEPIMTEISGHCVIPNSKLINLSVLIR